MSSVCVWTCPDSCVTITIHHYCLDTCGPCNNSHYLGQVENVYDDDDDDDDENNNNNTIRSLNRMTNVLSFDLLRKNAFGGRAPKFKEREWNGMQGEWKKSAWVTKRETGKFRHDRSLWPPRFPVRKSHFQCPVTFTSPIVCFLFMWPRDLDHCHYWHVM